MGAATATLAAGAAHAQSSAVEPPSTITTPRRDFGHGADPNAPIQRIWTGALWAEGPAWNAQGRYLVWSDIPNNRQMRWLEEDGHVAEFREPSNNSNGNSFDFQGNQLSAEHLTRRVVRYENDGSTTILANRFEGKRFNSPNDIVAHPDGSYWFTDPPYGGPLYEGAPDAPGGAINPDGLLNNRLGQPPKIGDAIREMETACYRVDGDGDGNVTRVATEADAPDPNGLCFSPDFKTLYVASTGKGSGDTGPGGQGNVIAFDVNDDNTLSNRRVFSECMVDDVKCGPDGVRCDVAGNLWASSNAGRNVGYSGVTVWAPDGTLLGRIRIPEICGNICFGGPKAQQAVYGGEPIHLLGFFGHARCRSCIDRIS